MVEETKLPEGYSDCPTCRGRGEVSAGITTGKDTSSDGERTLTGIFPNPRAIGKDGLIRLLDVNPLVPLWSTAVCGTCRGMGFLRNHQ